MKSEWQMMLRWAPIGSHIYILDWQVEGVTQLGQYQYCLLYIVRSRLVEHTLWFAEQA